MEDNEKQVDPTVEEETTQEEVESVEEETPNSPTLEDYERLKKETETLKAQKEHWRKKAQSSKPIEKEEKEINNNYLTRDEAILLAKGFDEDDLSKLKKLAGEGNLIEASNDPMFLAYKKEKERKEKSEKAQLGVTNGATKGQKPVSEMTDEEHKAYFYKTQGK